MATNFNPRQYGATPFDPVASGATRVEEVAPEKPSSFLGRTVRNIPGSAARFAGGLFSAVANPAQTIKNIGGLVGGAVDKIIPGKQGGEENFDVLVDFYKQRYGSIDQFIKTVEEDPVGVAADASVLLGGAGAVLRGAGAVSKVSGLQRVGSLATGASTAIDPISIVTKAGAPISRALEKSSLRLTPSQKSQLGPQKISNVTESLGARRFIGSPEKRFELAKVAVNKTEDALDNFLNSMSKGSGIKKADLIRSLQQLKGAYSTNRDANLIYKQIDDAIKTVKDRLSPKTELISFKKLNEFKRSTYENAYNKAGTKVLDDVEHAIGDMVRLKIENGLTGLKINGVPIEEFNRQYGVLLDTKKLLKASVGRPEISRLTEGVLGAGVGFGLGGGPLGGAAGYAVGQSVGSAFPATLLKSAASYGAKKASEMRRFGPAATAVQRFGTRQQD